LVGRADKCDRALKALLTIRVSRVHAVLIEVDGRPMLFDCASTNGSFVGGRRIRSVVLEHDPPVIELAGDEGIALRWTALRRGSEGR
jgi:pSer/pThr/pTyr-binding forkhead associated (FHA) protein